MSPLRLADIAAELSIHESTVSRAVREKYLQCARGVYPLSFFFTREVGAGEGQSAHEIKNQLLRLIREEDKRRPCSDEKLRQLLAVGGIRRLPPHGGQIPGGAGDPQRRLPQGVNQGGPRSRLRPENRPPPGAGEQILEKGRKIPDAIEKIGWI